MKITPENIDDVVALVQARFRTFGGGQVTGQLSPIAHALRGEEASFAAGVSVKDVVRFVIQVSHTHGIQ